MKALRSQGKAILARGALHRFHWGSGGRSRLPIAVAPDFGRLELFGYCDGLAVRVAEP
jgi:hypothetical protein